MLRPWCIRPVNRSKAPKFGRMMLACRIGHIKCKNPMMGNNICEIIAVLNENGRFSSSVEKYPERLQELPT